MAHSTNYTNTLIQPSPDCKAMEATIPTKAGSIAQRQYDLIREAPYGLTSDAILVTVQADRSDIPAEKRAAFREVFFSKGQPCLRCSPLVKTHGWAIHHDSDARVNLIDPQSADFAALMADPTVTKVDGMRNKRK